jgi:hypothetical protein
MSRATRYVAMRRFVWTALAVLGAAGLCIRSPVPITGGMRLAAILVLVAAVAFLGLSFKKAHDKATNPVKRLVAPAHVSPRQFRQVKNGMSVARVRSLLGSPDESARAGGQLCWDYGTPLSKGGMFAVCFRRGKVTYTSRIG